MQFWAEKKPLEELYDTQNDPHEINNLASDPAHFEKLAELRQAHINFVEEHGDLGMIPETDLIRMLWPPDGEQPITAAPEVTVGEDSIQINSGTEGASIAYRFSENESWKLYYEPIPLPDAEQIEAVAIRIGWKESDRVKLPLR